MSEPTVLPDDPFRTAADAEGPGVNFAEFEGSLVICEYVETTNVDTKQYGNKPAVKVNLYCVQGVEEGTKSKMPPQVFGAEPATLIDRTGESHPNMLIFQGFVRGAFRGCQPGNLVLGVPAVRGMKTSISKDDKDLKASYVLDEPTAEQRALAGKFWAQKAFKSPADAAPANPAVSANAAVAHDGAPPF